ncbi:MAG: heme biosynthesis protein HemY [Pseudomonadota bacterium]
MRFFLRLLILLIVAIGLAVTARFNPGNVVLFYPPYRIDLSLNFFIFLAALAFYILHCLLDALRSTREMPGKVAVYRREKREREGNEAFREALKALFEGRFGHAEKAARRAGKMRENSGLAALIGARAAHWMRQFERRDAWLAQVAGNDVLRPARLMTALELLVDEHQTGKALATVAELHAGGTRHIQALRLSLKANQYAKNWPEVLRLTRLLDKNNALHPALSSRLRELAYADMLSNQPHDAESLRNLWRTVPTDDRTRTFVATRAAETFNALGLHSEARELVEAAINVHWDDRLIRAYRRCVAPEATPALLAQIEQCEAWSIQRPFDAQLALTLGALCLKQTLWGKAQRYLEHALSQAGDASTRREIHLELGQLHEALDHAELAAFHYRESARLA